MNNRLYLNIQLIFDGKILQNTSRFARLQTAEGMRPRETFVFIVFSSSKRKDLLINRLLWYSLKK